MTDFKDRFLKFETLHGLYMVPIGVMGLYSTFKSQQHIFDFIGALIFGYAIIEGLRMIGYNPIKKAAAIAAKRAKYLHLFETPDAK